MSVRAKQPSSSTVGHKKRSPMKVQPLVGSTPLTYHQATNRRAMHQKQHEAMLHSLPYQGIVLTLLPFLPSPHRYIARMSSFSPANTNGRPGLHDCHKVMCNIPSLPSYSVVVSTQGLFQVISRPFGLVCEEPLFEISR